MHDQPKDFRWLHIASTWAYLVYAVLLFVKVVGFFVTADAVLDVVLLAFSPVVGYLLADFASGFVHFLGDTVGDEHTPVVGKAFIYAFREHHTDQKAITRHDFYYTNGNNCLVSLPVMLVLYHAVPAAWLANPWIAFAFASLFFLVISIFFTNQIHKWAHQDNPNAVARWLQARGLILTPARHRLHHTAPHDSHYCITTGWLNPLLEQLRFFPITKFVLARIPFLPEVK
ncbi:kua-ubiquitin conjugating enzyme hybrid localization domain protein [Candidatus Uhrbacteria bacterium]|nr:kua-ubiquitin conjugating enzyme hybrid localization domain protein [Candidatus Uhrbacteria bacterium]